MPCPAVAVGAAFLVRAAAGPDGWWQRGGGFLLLAELVVAFLAVLRFRR